MTRRIVWPTRSLLALACLTASAVGTTLRSEDFDHTGWNKIVKATVTEDGWVDYKAIQKKFSKELKGYIYGLGRASLKTARRDPDLPRVERVVANCVRPAANTIGAMARRLPGDFARHASPGQQHESPRPRVFGIHQPREEFEIFDLFTEATVRTQLLQLRRQ